jgi:SAM-dependent methyltransferase
MWPLILGRRRTSIHRIEQNHWLRELCVPLAPRSVINLGAEPDASDKEGKRYCDYFPDAEFKTLDQRPHDDPRYLQGDLMKPMAHLGTFDLVICMSVLEHVERPWLAAPNITDIVAPGGHLFISMPWFYPVHEGRDFGDFWRARPAGVELLFEELELVREEIFSSALLVVRDRRKYWRDPDATAAGSILLFRKPT